MAGSIGLERILHDPSLLDPVPTALCANYTSVTHDLVRGVDALLGAGIPLVAMLTPEHGYWGAAQAGYSDGDGVDESTSLPILDTYGVSGSQLDALIERSGAQQILVDLQDIGTRFYTYTWTLFDLMCAAARTGTAIVIADRPNPLGRRRLGPGLDPACASFVGRVSIPLQHGLTLAELARWFALEHVPQETGRELQLSVIGIDPADDGAEGRAAGSVAHPQRDAVAPWVMPSPNIPTADTAILYPATALLEGTLLSEGRGTTRPFELFGAGWTDRRLAAALREHELPGIAVREAVFRPQFSKWEGETVHGAQLHLLDAALFDPLRTAHTILSTLRELHPEQPLWRERGPGEPGSDRPPFLDLLWGSSALREGIEERQSLTEILAGSPPAPAPPPEALLHRTTPTEETTV